MSHTRPAALTRAETHSNKYSCGVNAVGIHVLTRKHKSWRTRTTEAEIFPPSRSQTTSEEPERSRSSRNLKRMVSLGSVWIRQMDDHRGRNTSSDVNHDCMKRDAEREDISRDAVRGTLNPPRFLTPDAAVSLQASWFISCSCSCQ